MIKFACERLSCCISDVFSVTSVATNFDPDLQICRVKLSSNICRHSKTIRPNIRSLLDQILLIIRNTNQSYCELSFNF